MSTKHRFRAGSMMHALRLGIASMLALPVVAALVTPAYAGVGLSVVPTFSTPVTVGQSGIPASLSITNGSTGPDAANSVTLTSITLVPSCGGSPVLGNCAAADVDPGVFQPSATGSGVAGTACAGVIFTFAVSDPTQGKYALTPSATVVLGTPASATQTCTINFTFSTLKAPTKDALANPGIQTNQIASAAATNTTTAVSGSGSGFSTTTVVLAASTISTTATPSVTSGSSISDSATVTGVAGAPVPTGTVTFSPFGPSNATCTGGTAAGPYVTALSPSGPTTATTTTGPVGGLADGTYRWVAAYSGDANYLPSTGACNDPNETSVISPPSIAGINISSSYPTSIVVGQSGSATITLSNPDTVAHTPSQISFVPECGTSTFDASGDCPAANQDPGVLTVSNGTGSGAGCPGTTFTFTFSDASHSKYDITPSTPVNLAPSASCVISFSLYAAKAPSADSNAATPGTQTAVDAKETTGAFSGLSPGEITISPASSTISTVATTASTGATPISDTATVAGVAGAPTPTGTVDFGAYGPNDPTCAGTASIFQGGVALIAATPTTATASSSPVVPAAGAGVYRWRAFYSGDANYSPVAGLCNAPNETSTYGPQPTMTTSATASAPVGGQISDSATLSNTTAPTTQPTGTITFNVYGPADATCTGIPVFTSNKTVTTNGPYTSDPYTAPTSGTYRWIATYSGDVNNNAATNTCNAPNEHSVVGPQPTIASNATSATIVNHPITDTATLSGSSAPATQPTGTMTFRLYGPGDTTCTAAPVYTNSQGVTSNGPIQSAPYTPTTAGTYRWVASYSGDANNAPVASACNAANESTQVSPGATPAVTSAATSTAVLGASLTDTASLTGSSAPVATPTGTFTFRVYGPNDASCTGAITFTSTAGLDASGSASSGPFVPASPGVYRWIASYSGDSNNSAAVGSCNAAGETSNVGVTVPTLSTSATSSTLGTGTISDTATVGSGTAPTGTITFRLYGPSDSGCASAAIFTSTKTVSGNGSLTSDPYTPTSPGTYRWIATYSGDANNGQVAGPCGAPGESSVVSKAGPTLTTSASSDGVLGQSVTDTATLSGSVAPTGTITFRLYAPSDPSCSGTAVFSNTKAVTGNGALTSDPFTPTSAGIYRWIATYSGDANNASAAGSCSSAGESVTITVAPRPALAESSSGGVVTLVATVLPRYVGETCTFYVRSGITGVVRPLGKAPVGSDGRAVRILRNMHVGQHLLVYCKLSTSAGITTPYSNDVAFVVR